MPKDITTTTTVYTIHELSEEAREKAIENHRDWNTSDEFWFEMWSVNGKPGDIVLEKGIENGFNITRFYFSGFWSQGDGACFQADVDYEEYILKNKLGNKYRTLLNHARVDGGSLTIKTHGMYSHAYSMQLEDYDHYFNATDDTSRAWQAAEKAGAQADELAEMILDHGRDLANEFYRQLEKEYDYLSGDEQVIDSLDINEMLFTEDGNDYR